MPIRHLVVIFLLAAVVRGAWVLADSHGTGEIAGDAQEYHDYAVSVLDHGTYTLPDGHRAYRAPGFPLLIAGVFGMAGRHVAAIQIVHVILGAAACVVIALATARLLPFPWPLLAGVFSAIYVDAVAGTPRVLTEPLLIFTIALLLYWWLAPPDRWPRASWLAGLAAGAGSLVRSETIAVALCLALWAVVTEWPDVRRRAVPFVLGWALVLSPWVIRNAIVLHGFVPATSEGGPALYAGLQWPLSNLGVIPAEMYRPPKEVPELDADRMTRREGMRLLRETPPLLLIKAYAFNLATLGYPFLPAYDWSFVFIVPFVLYGAWICREAGWRRARGLWLVLGSLVVVYTLFGTSQTRFRQSLSPVLILLGVIGLARLAQRWRPRPVVVSVAAWAGLNLLVAVASDQVRQVALHIKHAIW